MVVTELNQQLIDAGERLTRQLDKSNNVTASLWFYQSDSAAWRLLIACPALEGLGPKKGYSAIQRALKRNVGPAIKLSLDEIALIPETHPLLGLLRTAIHTGEGISSIRFSRNTINGYFIEDAYIYRV